MIPRTRGLVELVLAACCLGLMAYLTKLTTAELDGAQAAFIRFALGLAVVLGWTVARRARLRVVRLDLLLYRGFWGSSAVLMYFLSIAHLPVGTATLLCYTAPIFSALFAALFLAERVPALRAGAMMVAAVGVGLVVYGQGQALGGGGLWMLVGVTSAVCSGAGVTSVRAARRTEGVWEVFAALCVVGLLTTAPLALHAWRAPGLRLWLLLVAMGLMATAGQMLITHALAAVDAATAGIVGQLTVIVSLGLGHFLHGDPFGRVSMIGTVLTVVGVSAVLRVASPPAAILRSSAAAGE